VPRLMSVGVMAKLLAVFRIRPTTIWPLNRNADSRSSRGYHRHQFEDCWRRYCPESDTPTHTSKIRQLRNDWDDTRPTRRCVTDEAAAEPPPPAAIPPVTPRGRQYLMSVDGKRGLLYQNFFRISPLRQLHLPEKTESKFEDVSNNLSERGRLGPLNPRHVCYFIKSYSLDSSASCCRFGSFVARIQSVAGFSICGISGQLNQAQRPAPDRAKWTAGLMTSDAPGKIRSDSMAMHSLRKLRSRAAAHERVPAVSADAEQLLSPTRRACAQSVAGGNDTRISRAPGTDVALQYEHLAEEAEAGCRVR
jgi:hypothetical protein